MSTNTSPQYLTLFSNKLYQFIIKDDEFGIDDTISRFPTEEGRLALFTTFEKSFRHHPVIFAASRASICVVDYLTSGSFKSFANMRDNNGISTLHFAAASRSVEVVKLLLDRGADLSIQDDLGYTPLHAALSQSKDGANFDVVSYLLSATKNITNLKTRWFISPLDIAITMQDRQSYDLLVACQISTSPDNKDAHPQYPFSSGLQIRNASMTSIASNNSLRVSGGTNFGDTAQAASAMTSLLDVPPPPSVPVTTGSKSLRGKPTKKKASPKSKTKTSPKQGSTRTRGKKKKKDEDKPKKPRKAMSGYNYFFKDKSAELKKQRNAAKSTDAFTYGTIGSQMGDMWRKLSPEAKKPFLARAKMDSQRYAAEKKKLITEFNQIKSAGGLPNQVSLEGGGFQAPKAVQPGWSPLPSASKPLTNQFSPINTPSPTLSENSAVDTAAAALPLTTITGIPVNYMRPPIHPHINDDATVGTSASIHSRGSKDSFSVLSDVAFAMENSYLNSAKKPDGNSSSTSTSRTQNDAGSLSSFSTINSSNLFATEASMNNYIGSAANFYSTAAHYAATSAAAITSSSSSVNINSLRSSTTISTSNIPPPAPGRGSMNSTRSSGTGGLEKLGFDFTSDEAEAEDSDWTMVGVVPTQSLSSPIKKQRKTPAVRDNTYFKDSDA